MKQNPNVRRITLLRVITIFFTCSLIGNAQISDKIKYNAVYNCGEGKINFKVLSCDDKGRNAVCKVFYINKYAPGGGHTEDRDRSFIEDNFVGVCAIEGGNTNAEKQLLDDKTDERTANRVGASIQIPKPTIANDGQFKIGDRVQVTLSGIKEEKNYQPCTIMRGLEHNSYGIGCDPWHGQPYLEYSALPSWVRPWANATAASFPVEKLRVDNDDTVLADRAPINCDFNHGGRNGSPPPADLAKKLIRCLYERPSPKGQDGVTTMDITAFTIGTPHRWSINQDMGQGKLDTLVYPARVKWNMKTFYRTRNVEVRDKEMMFTCFVDTANLWQCGTATGSHQDGKTQEIVVTKE